MDGAPQQRRASENTESAEIREEKLRKFFIRMAKTTSAMQRDIVNVMLKSNEVRHTLMKQLRMPENEMMKITDNAIRHFISVLPLAQEMGANLFMTMLTQHSVITGDNTMIRIVDHINQKFGGFDRHG